MRLRNRIILLDDKIEVAQKEYDKIKETMFELQARRNARHLLRRLKRHQRMLRERLRKLILEAASRHAQGE
jgi:hypothetical protein